MNFTLDSFDDDDEAWYKSYGGRDGHVFIIDSSKNMYDDGKLEKSVGMIKQVMQNIIIKNEKNMVGVLLYNTEKSVRSLDDVNEDEKFEPIQNISELLKFRTVSATSIKCIRRFKDDGLTEFPVNYGHCDTNPGCFNIVLWHAMRMIQGSGFKMNDKEIVIFTDKNIPFPNDSPEERSAFKKAEDLRDSGIRVTLIPMSENFGGEAFYNQFLSIVNEAEIEDVQKEIEMLCKDPDDKVKRCFKKNYSKRCNSRIKFHFGQGLDMSVGIYSMHREAKPPKKVILTSDDNSIVISKRVATQVIEVPETGQIMEKNVLPSEESKYQKLGDEKVVFSKREETQMKRIMNPGIILLGFKPKSSLVLSAHLRGPNFLYPDETIIKGSTKLFIALWRKCLDMDKVAYAILTQREGALPKLVALVPQEEETGKNFERYSGFRIEYIPYVDSIRELDIMNEIDFPQPISEHVEIFKKVVRKLRFRYSPYTFHNPSVCGKYKIIEATVLEEEHPPFVDCTLPDTDLQDERLGELIGKFNELFEPDEETKVQKRKGSDTSGAPAPKVQKTVNFSQIQNAYNNGSLESFTVDNLKSFLVEKGKTGLSKLKKADLIKMVEEIMEDDLLSSVNV
uniref:CSON012453 protein n=1 Tax=Culicoides sonorensis TaxID=179676 RepID=A0A336M5J1_CULSO